jgi:hypothetical protein
VLTNLIERGAIFQPNPFLTVLGYMFLVDWSAPPWQVLALAVAVLNVAVVCWIDYVGHDYRDAAEHHDQRLLARAEHKFGWIERLLRLRLLLVLAFWVIVAGHTVLYFNTRKCWFTVPSSIERSAQLIYGDRLPPNVCERETADSRTVASIATVADSRSGGAQLATR